MIEARDLRENWAALVNVESFQYSGYLLGLQLAIFIGERIDAREKEVLRNRQTASEFRRRKDSAVITEHETLEKLPHFPIRFRNIDMTAPDPMPAVIRPGA